MLGGLDRVEPTLRARGPLSLAFDHPTLQWPGRAESNVLQTRSVAALVWAVGQIFYDPTLQWVGWAESGVLHIHSAAALAVGCESFA